MNWNKFDGAENIIFTTKIEHLLNLLFRLYQSLQDYHLC
jgi:hypothetical protein